MYRQQINNTVNMSSELLQMLQFFWENTEDTSC